jgi:predicted DNA-binding transcriptional regulator AlpA
MSTDTGNTDTGNDVCLNALAVRMRYGGRSDMWLWRRLENDPDFPRPIRIGRKRYWRLSELLAFEEQTRAPNATPA